MEKLDGTAISEAIGLSLKQREKIFKKMGAYLQELHEHNETRYGYLGVRHSMEPQTT
ncbi:MAG: hypothetical protein ACTSUN_08195 [Promethearchaeota archaeon]